MRTSANGSNFGGWFFTAGVLFGLSGCGGESSSGGAANGANDGSTSTTFGHCDVKNESSANPIIEACGDITGPLGVNVKLGPYGAQMDVNVGAGFENPDPADSATCSGFVNLFPEDQTITQQLLDVGPQPCTTSTPNTGNCLNFQLYSVYRPAKWPDGKIPVITWGNGTCAQPEGYGTLLRYIASYGFFVVAANSREVGNGTNPMLHALDYAAAANQDPSSPYYGHLDLSKVGAMGHSQGSQATVTAASDSRIQSVILFNGGDTAVKPYLALSGDLDLFGYTAQSMSDAVNGQPKAAFLYYHNPAGNTADNLRGHLVLMLTPERVMEQAIGFWQMMLDNDTTARNLFVGASCAFCNHSTDYDYGQHGL